jgi:membrane protease YdiL (CAAX protease family)
MTEGPMPQTTPTARPRIWPLFAGFFAAVFTMLAANAAMLALVLGWFIASYGPNEGPRRLGGWITSLGALALSAAITGGAIALVALSVPRLLKERVRESLSLGPSPLRAPHIAAVALATFAGGVAYGQVAEMLGYGDVGVLAQISKSIHDASWGAWAVSTLGLALVPGVAEELFFRGFLQTRAQARWGRTAGIAIASVLFGLFHMDPKQGLYACIIGFLLGWVATRAGSIRPAMIAHGTSNFLGLFFAKVGTQSPTNMTVRIATIAIAVAIIAAVVAFVARSTRPALDRPPAPS